MNQQASPNLARAIVTFHKVITRGLEVSLENARLGNSSLDRGGLTPITGLKTV